MHLPGAVRQFIDDYARQVGFAEVKRAAARISENYRAGGATRDLDQAAVAAYLVTRMPATYAAAFRVLQELRERLGPVESILDVGAGPGAASLAARAHFPEASITMLERAALFRQVASDLLPDAEIIAGDARVALPVRDLVIAAYSYGEFGGGLSRLWAASRKALVVIEPGTPRGFEIIRAAREELLPQVALPCPAAAACPIVAPDWCHFAARVERSSLHRQVKGGELNFEDEKFSYVVFTREPVERAQARIVRRPVHQPGLIVLETCTPQGLATRRVFKRDKPAFRTARHASWGDAIETLS